jgi:pimeloyl-ACP methyl ester carboxylesterase
MVPHAHYVDVSGAAHMVAGDCNDRFTEAVVAFLRDNVPTTIDGAPR